MIISANAIILTIISLAMCNFKDINGIKCIRELYAINISEKSSSPSECSTNLSCVSVICSFDNKEFVYAKDCVQADRPVDYVSITKECKALKGDDAFTRPDAYRARIKQCNSSDFCNERMLYWNLTTAKHISMPSTTLHAIITKTKLTVKANSKKHTVEATTPITTAKGPTTTTTKPTTTTTKPTPTTVPATTTLQYFFGFQFGE